MEYKKSKDTYQNPKSQTQEYYFSKAPYNFIPLNNELITIKKECIPSFDTYHKDLYTGYISLEIETLTPLYIRDTLNDEEYSKMLANRKRKDNKKEKPFANPAFFSPGSLIRIPGSSMRGMIRTLIEIVSFGKFINFHDRKLYYRSFADRCKRLRDEYRKYIKPQGGILKKEGLSYYIEESNFEIIKEKEAKAILLNYKLKDAPYEIQKLKYKNKSGYLVISPLINGRKKYYFIEIPSSGKRIKLSKEDIKDYKNDKERKAGINLLKELERKDEVPCFFSKYIDSKGNNRIAFGHTKMFRIPYIKSIGEHIPEKLRKEENIDFAEAIFGRESDFASRVFFEDFYLIDTQNPLLPEGNPKILSTPKPTCFQHYLVQGNENLKDFPKNLAHYNDGKPIRGYKLYWHREANNWKATKEEVDKHISQYTTIRPVREGAKFQGIIRFENLTKEELGALLFVLHLPEECAHRLGMVKPLGLGSIKIKPKLYLSERQRRYQDLFHEWSENLSETPSIEDFKKSFESFILSKLSSNLKTLWEHERIKKLKIMLNFKKHPVNTKTDYLDLGKFKDRKVLPDPEKVYDNKLT